MTKCDRLQNSFIRLESKRNKLRSKIDEASRGNIILKSSTIKRLKRQNKKLTIRVSKAEKRLARIC